MDVTFLLILVAALTVVVMAAADAWQARRNRPGAPDEAASRTGLGRNGCRGD